MLAKIPILKSLRYKEKQTGKDVTLQDEHPDLANANKSAALNEKAMPGNTRPQAAMGSAQLGQQYVESDSLSPRLEGSGTITTVYVGNIPPNVRVSELKYALREFHATPLKVNWQGAQHRAFLDYKDKAAAESAVSSLKGLSLGGNTLRVELAKNQRNKGQVEINSQKLIWMEEKKKKACFYCFARSWPKFSRLLVYALISAGQTTKAKPAFQTNEAYISQLTCLPHSCSCTCKVHLSRWVTEEPFL